MVRFDSRSRPVRLYLLLLIAFILGVAAERVGLLPGSSPWTPPSVGKIFRPFWEAWALVQKYYVDRSAVQPVAMTRGAIEGMLNSLGDIGHTTYLTQEELKQMLSALEGHLDGIGARMSMRNNLPTITGTVPDSPARAAGLRPGDVLLAVDGKDVDHLPLDRIGALVRGPEGATVDLRILRKGETLDFHITRAKVEIAEVTWHLLPGVPVAHLAIATFGTHVDDQLKSALEQARAQGAKALLIDVRGNPGGLEKKAVTVTSQFLRKGDVFIEQDAEGNRKAIAVEPGGMATDIPLCVLIDSGTASAAEIFAGAIQDHQRGKLVGTKTFGTGTVLRPFELSDGSAILLAVTEWLTPRGRQIWHQGITPDIEEQMPEDASILLPDEEGDLTASALTQSQDKQLLKALEVLHKETKEPWSLPANHPSGPAAPSAK
jgi:carboxyl-terminal processing protease